VTGLVTSFGSGAMTNSLEDIANEAQLYFIIGSNTTENHPVLGMKVRQAVKQRGAKVIVADPRRIPITDFATMHLQQRPGTDIALLNGLAKVLIEEELYDKDYVATRTEGFDDLKASLAKLSLEQLAQISGIAVAQMQEAARLMAATRPGALLYAMGITQHTTGHQNVLACANLQMLLGNVGAPGGGVNPLRGQNNVQGACDMGCLPTFFPAYQLVANEEVRTKFQKVWGKVGAPKGGLTVIEMLNAAERGQVKGLFVLGENPGMTDPDTNHARKALEATEFLVVQEIFPSETTPYADVILPGVAFAEKDGTYTNTERRVQLLHQALTPPGQARQDWWIITELAKRLQARLGVDPTAAPYAAFHYDSPKQIMAEVAAVTPSYGGITYERIEKVGLQWPCPNTAHPGTPILHRERFSRGLGKLVAVEWLPPAELPDAAYPLVLTTGRILYHFHGGTMSRRSKGLNEHRREGVVEIHPADAQNLGIQDGELVKVSSRRGEVTAKAEVVERTGPGVVFMTFHFAEAAANLLTIAALDPIAKIPELKVCAVKVEKA
jgi:formate dehydrogenase alpha subunit